MSVLLRLTAIVEAAVNFCGRLAAWVCVALVLLVAGNVLARYFFHTGTIWLQELEWHLISPIALVGMSYGLLRGDQVRIDIVYDKFPPYLRALVEVITGLLLVIFAVAIIKLSLPFVHQAYRIGEGSPNPGGLSHRWLLKAFIPFGFALLAAQALCHTLRHARSLLSGK